jgi:UTP--glucose-1-phosphate uridylyltransferase
MTEVTDAVILAGGRGTRMLPATLYMPKEALPLVDTPILNHIIWEACRAGVERIHIVLSDSKKDLLAGVLEHSGPLYSEDVRPDMPRVSLSSHTEDIELLMHVQKRPGGVADAIATALHAVNGPFLVLLGDNLLISEHHGPAHSGPEHASMASLKLVERFAQTGLPSAGVLNVPKGELSKYGVADLEEGLVKSIVEKPAPSDAPSSYVLCGRYLLPENTAELLELIPESEYGELQSIALFEHLINHGGFEAVRLEGYELYDSGDPVTWLKSQIDHALRREDMSEELLSWLRERTVS